MDEKLLPTLREAFTATFHSKFAFHEFLDLDVSSEITVKKFRQREIYAPSKKLATFQRFTANTILGHAKINDRVTFSYIKGRKASDALPKHRHNKFFYKTDIENFFHGFTRNDVEKSIQSNAEQLPISDIKHYKNRIVSLTSYQDRLPIGFVTSPSLSNIILFDFDTLLEEYCDSLSIAYSRYSDDIIFSGNELNALYSTKDYLSELLRSHFLGRLTINEKKTKVLHKGQKIKLLGSVILPNGKITVEKSLKTEIEVFLHFYLNDKDKLVSYFKKDLDSAISEIEGKLNYANDVDYSYVDKLRSKYGNAIIDMLIHKSISA